MAKASWLTVDPMSGSGNDTLNNTAPEHTGREARETTVTGTAIGVSSPDTYVVEQEGKAEFIQFDNGASAELQQLLYPEIGSTERYRDDNGNFISG